MRFFKTYLSAMVFLACLAIGAASAGALGVSVDTPVVGVNVDAGSGGVNVGASVPAAGTNVDANVGTGDGGVSVDANVDTPAGNVNANVGSPNSNSGSGSGSSGSSQGGQGSGGGSQSQTSSSRSGSAADGDSPGGRTAREKGGSTNRSASRSRDRQPVGTTRRNQKASPADAGGLVGLVAASYRLGSKPEAAPGQGADASVVAQLVSHVPDWLWAALALLAVALLAALAFAVHERRKRRRSDELAMLDPLTEIANVKAFDQRLAQEWARAQRHGGKLGVLLIDLDRFKEVNDTHGHAAGDKVLTAVAIELVSRTRESDLVARIGGDEFAVICPETGLTGLQKLGDKLAEELPPLVGYDVGVSVGAAAIRTRDEVPSEMVARADRAMYQRKASHHKDGESAARHLEAV